MISVVIPVYNTEKHVERCIRSVLAQKGDEKEIILVDDGSTDSSPALCDKFAIEYPNIVRVIHKENEGVSVARNIGIEEAKGEFIAFIDSDDDLETGMFSAFDEAISKHSIVDIILTGYKVVDSDGNMCGGGMVQRQRFYGNVEQDFLNCLDQFRINWKKEHGCTFMFGISFTSVIFC